MTMEAPARKEQLMEFALTHMAVQLNPDLNWTGIMSQIVLSAFDARWFDNLVCWYFQTAGKDALQDAAAQQLFAAGIHNALCRSNEQDSWLEQLDEIGACWLQSGSVDMEQEQADMLGPLIVGHLSRSNIRARDKEALTMLVLHSPRLWAMCKHRLLHEKAAFNGVIFRSTMQKDALFFRHAPQHFWGISPGQKEHLYNIMCCVYDSPPLKPAAVAAILTGVHANTKAWRRPLERSMLKHSPDVLASKWSGLAPAFAALAYDPGDESAWSVWTMLHTDGPHAEHLLPVRVAVQQENPAMQGAYNALWPIVEGLFAPHERCGMAAKMWVQRHENVLALPVDGCLENAHETDYRHVVK